MEYVAIREALAFAEFGKLTRVCEVDKQREHFQTQAKQGKNHRHETACLENDRSFFWRLTFERHGRNQVLAAGRR